MIVNAYSILDGFVALLRLGLAVPVVVLALTTWRRWKRKTIDDREAVENRLYMVLLLAGLLLILNILAWPLFYLLLQSYVPEWPGVMCIYGVTRIGAGTIGPARHLPAIVSALQMLKPLVVFLSGAWFVLYLINRRTRTAPFTGRVLIGIVAAAMVSVADAGAELTYLAIPKKEEFLSSGCCTTAINDDFGPGRFLPSTLLRPSSRKWLTGVFVVANALLLAGLVAAARICRRRMPTRWLGPILALAGTNVLIGAVFLTEVAAPQLLQMPNHHCPYDLVERAPAVVVAVAFFLSGSFGAGWACVAAWFAGGTETMTFRPRFVGMTLRLSVFGYVGSVALLVAELLRV